MSTNATNAAPMTMATVPNSGKSGGGAEPDRGQHAQNWAGTAHGARRHPDADDCSVLFLLGAHDGDPNIDSTIFSVSSG